MIRFLLAALVAAALVSCDKGASGPNTPTTPTSTPPATSTPTAAKPTTPEIKTPAGLEDLKKTAAAGAAEVKKTTAAVEGQAKEVAATAKEASAKATETATAAGKDILAAIPGLEGLTESSFSADKLKGLIGSLKPDQLQGIADKLVATLKEKMGNLGGLTDLAKSGAGTADLVKSLKEKLTLVVDKLKASGIDVSKYTSFLN